MDGIVFDQLVLIYEFFGILHKNNEPKMRPLEQKQ